MTSNSEKEQARTFEEHQAEQAEADEVGMLALKFLSGPIALLML